MPPIQGLPHLRESSHRSVPAIVVATKEEPTEVEDVDVAVKAIREYPTHQAQPAPNHGPATTMVDDLRPFFLFLGLANFSIISFSLFELRSNSLYHHHTDYFFDSFTGCHGYFCLRH